MTMLFILSILISINIIAAFCNWGPDGTASTSTCTGGAQGGTWCNTSKSNCETGCNGKWCTTETCPFSWKQASWTTYTSYAPCCKGYSTYDPTTDTTECTQYSACSYVGDFAYIGHKTLSYVKNNNLVAMFSTHGDMNKYKAKNVMIFANDKTIKALVADTCGDSDCSGCCTKNAQPSGYLIDMEYWTVMKNYNGNISVANGLICWKKTCFEGLNRKYLSRTKLNNFGDKIAVTHTCKWLQNQDDTVKKAECKKSQYYNGYVPAKKKCKFTCGTCS